MLLGTRVAIEIGCQAVLFGIGSINTEEKEYTEPFGHPPIEDFPEWEPVHIILLGNNVMGVENAGGDIEKVTGPALYHCGLPAALVYGDGTMIRMAAITDEEHINRNVPDRVCKYGVN